MITISRHILAFLLVLVSISTFGQYETGSYQVYNYSSKIYKAHAQNFAVTQDSRGIMFFGNNNGVIEFDGNSWRFYKVLNEQPVRCINVHESGRVYVGSEDEFGYFFPDSLGQMSYTSFINLLPEKERQTGKIKKVQFLEDKVYFQGKNTIYIYANSAISTLKTEKEIAYTFTLNDAFYCSIKGEGNYKLTNGELNLIHLIKNPEAYISDFITVKDRNYCLIPHEGIFEIDNHDSLRRVISIEDPDLLVNSNKLSHMDNGRFILGTWTKGIFIIDEKGRVLQKISEESGLQNATVNDQMIDSHGVLWLAMENGISKIDLYSPLSLIGKKHGLTSTVESLTRHKGTLYLATSTGVGYLTPCLDYNDSELPSVKYLTSISGQTWGIHSFQHERDTLLVFTDNEGIHEILPSGKVNKIASCYPWRFIQSKKYPDRLYVGLEPGLMVLKRANGAWKTELVLEELEIVSRRLSEDADGAVWLSSEQDGIARVDLTEKDGELRLKSVEYFKEKEGIPSGSTVTHHGQHWNLTGTSQGLYRYHEALGKFIPDTIIGNLFRYTKDAFVRLNEDYAGNIWLVGFNESDNSSHVSYVSQPNTMNEYLHRTAPFVELSDFTTYCIFHEPNGISWLGGPAGVFQFDESHHRNYKIDFNTSVRKVVIGEDKLLFGGSYVNESNKVANRQNPDEYPMLDYTNNSLTFEYASHSFEDDNNNLYSYYLEGFSKEWTAWKAESKAIFTNLHEGTYTFKVKSKNKFHHEGTEAQYHFSILPPWYRTWWAYLGYLIGFFTIVKGAIEISSRSLKAIIEEKTAEVVQQKEEIEAKNATLEHANQEISLQKHVIEEKNKDIVDSINYAEKIQRAILPQEELRTRILPQSFVLFRPKDIVSGDFYWLAEKENKSFFTAADCTGHGVPGAFMSMIGISLLNETVNEKGTTSPGKILDAVKAGVIKSLKQGEYGESKDGMDAALCTLDHQTNILEFAGANNPLYFVRKGDTPLYSPDGNRLNIAPYLEDEGLKLYEIKANKMPLAYYPGKENEGFTNHSLQLQEGDIIYIASDGFPDQFGGPKGKKFMYKKFKKLLMSLYAMPIEEQQNLLEKTILDWMGDEHEQIDDICIIGVRA